MKYFRYLNYLFAHKWFVFVAGIHVGVSPFRLLIHDWTKFLPSEFFAYADFFFGAKDRTPVQRELAADRFRLAWLHHKNHAPHHWEHWLLPGTADVALRMPDKFAREMVADWMGAGRTITGKWEVREWYAANRERIVLHKTTRYIVDVLVREVEYLS